MMRESFRRLRTLRTLRRLGRLGWGGVRVSGFVLILLGSGLAGCETGDPLAKEQEAIEAYKAAHSITAEPLASGLYYIETRAGSGVTPKYGSQVKVKYKGTFTDGTEFDSGTFSFYLGYGNVISGWDEGISYMKESGKATLIIPSSLGYGTKGYGDIPGYTPLVFDVELIDVF